MYFKGWTPLIIIFCCLSLSAIAPSCSVLRTRAPSYSYGVDPPPLGAYFARLVCPSDSLNALTKTRWVNSLWDRLTGWAFPQQLTTSGGCLKFVFTPFYVVGSPSHLRWGFDDVPLALHTPSGLSLAVAKVKSTNTFTELVSTSEQQKLKFKAYPP